MNLFRNEPKTEEQVREAVNKAVGNASEEMSKINDTRSDVENTAYNMPTLAAGVAAVETVIVSGKEIADTVKTAAVDFAKSNPTVSNPTVEQPDNSGEYFSM